MENPNLKVISQKFGGTSVATAERRLMVVGHVQREINSGYKVALVISAMGRRGDPYATDTVLDLLRNQGGEVVPRNYSFIFVTGEMISVAVMVHTLQLGNIPAVALTGGMAGIITEDFHMSAKVTSMDNRTLVQYLKEGTVPVVCGGQGSTQTAGDFSILGRGGSDTTGVLVGIMTQAERADIYTDVEYMLAADPRVIPDAPKREVISFEAAYEMARFGAKVVHPGSVLLGMQHNLPIRVRSTFSQNPGTLITDHVDSCPLVGLPVVGSVQVATMNGKILDESERNALEQHVGLLSLIDASSGELMLCAPSGDTLGLVDMELEKVGITGVSWKPGYSLLSLVGLEEAIVEMDKKSRSVMNDYSIPYLRHEMTKMRVTYVIPEEKLKTALAEVYSKLRGYLSI